MKHLLILKILLALFTLRDHGYGEGEVGTLTRISVILFNFVRYNQLKLLCKSMLWCGITKT